MSFKIGVIGAGISSAVFSKLVKDVALVEVFEKSRGTGGRLSRHFAQGFNFDIGCQDIILPSPFIPNIVSNAITENALVPWKPTFRIHNAQDDTININLEDIACYCGNGNMNQFAKWAFDDTKITFQTKIIELISKDRAWFLLSDNGKQYGPFDMVVLSFPAPQIMALTQAFNEELSKVKYDSCLVINLGLHKALSAETPEVIKSEEKLARWIIQSHLKPNLKSKPGITIQSKPLDYFDLIKDKENLSKEMIKETVAIIDNDFKIEYKSEHVWRYSKCTRPINMSLLYKNNIGVIGDCLKVNSKQSNIESCIDSAINLSQHIKKYI